MADPVFVDCPADAWTKVATNVLVGKVHQVIDLDLYLQTYRLTGEAAPTLLAEGVRAFPDSITEAISSDAPIDAYIWAHAKAGRVRVDVG